MKAGRVSRGIAPLILNLGAKRRWLVNFTLRPLFTGEKTSVPIEQEADWVPGAGVDGFGEETIPYRCQDTKPGNCSPLLVAKRTLYSVEKRR
jgi:hypothetical protein